MSEQITSSRVNRVRNRLYASFAGRVVAYANLATGAHIALASEQVAAHQNALLGVGLGLGSVAASVVERRFAHKKCDAVVAEGDLGKYNHDYIGKDVVASSKRASRMGALLNMPLAPYAAIATIGFPNPETVPESVQRTAYCVGAIGAIGIAGGVSFDMLSIRESIDGYSRQIAGQEPIPPENNRLAVVLPMFPTN